MTRPNVILVMTDDQGYGDLGSTGNPWISTPNLDALATQCTRATDFHVSALCTPTRGALMCGRNPLRNGAWATTWGHSMLGRDEVTMAEVFSDSGYRTGMFGKWHIGDNYPYRPQDRGFQTVVAHRGGGVGQTPDFWDNNYFDDTYFRNGRPEDFDGYCTDIWFDEAMSFIETNREQPFFCYLATNAPHAPYRVAERFSDLYAENDDIPEPAFYGMITNIDENMGRLVAHLESLGLAENTILIFMTDNGSSGGWTRDGRGYNAGMRGQKGDFYDGGHRVPFFIRWPDGSIPVDRDVTELITHMDLLPTFIDLCDLRAPEGVVFDGQSVGPILTGQTDRLCDDRIHFVQHHQGSEPPTKWIGAVMTRQWRLIEGRELYDIKVDPGQINDVAGDHPDVVARLRAAYDAWWAEVSPGLGDHHPVVVGSDHENPMRLDAFDLTGDVAWDQSQIRRAVTTSGTWAIDVERAGRYEISLRRWPEEVGAAIDAKLPEGDSVAITASGATLSVAGINRKLDLTPGDTAATFTVDLPVGRTDLSGQFLDADGTAQCAYYAYVQRMD